jgi:GxxExxY protein
MMGNTIAIENPLSYEIIGAAIKVDSKLGPGLLESVYEKALAHELTLAGFNVKSHVPVPMVYEDIKMEIGFQIDLMINDLIIIEIKSVETIADVRKKQLLTYLKLTKKKLGLLINFNSFPLKKWNC